MEDENSIFGMEGNTESLEQSNGFVDEFADHDLFEGGDLSIDLDMLFGIIDEERDKKDSDPSQNCSEFSLKNASQGEAVPSASHHDSACPENDLMGPSTLHPSYNSEALDSMKGTPIVAENDLVGPSTFHPSYNSEASDSMTGVSGGSFGSAMNQNLIFDSRVQRSPVNAWSASLKDWISLAPSDETYLSERASFSLPTSGTSSNFPQRDANNSSDFLDKFNSTLQGVTEIQIRNNGAEISRQGALEYPGSKNIGINFCKNETFGQNIMDIVGPPTDNLHTSAEIPFMGADMRLGDIACKDSAICPNTQIMSDYSSTQCNVGIDYHFHNSYNSQFFTINEELKNSVKDEEGEFPAESTCSSTKMKLNGHFGENGKSSLGFSTSNYMDIEGCHYGYEGNDYVPSMGCSWFDADGCPVDDKAVMQPWGCAQSYICSEENVKDEKPEEVVAPSISMWHSVDVIDEAVSREHSYSADNKSFGEDLRSSFFGISSSLSGQKTEHQMDDKEDHVTYKKVCRSPDNINGRLTMYNSNGNLKIDASEQYMPFAQPFSSIGNQSMCVMGPRISKVSPESSHSNFSEKSVVEDDSDICIIEDISHPAPSNQSLVPRNMLVTSQSSAISDNYVNVGGMRFKAKDERLILRLLQDLSQPKSETNPPDGVLAVPLLRHQRIALSWMVQKETDSAHCSGGILADDQGLGKTVSTIALILKERPPSFKACHVKQDETETLNLDEDDVMLSASNGMKEESDPLQVVSNETPIRSKNSSMLAKGRPAAGTLIVCPTSVLRQWDEELRNKVTQKANLSVLVYHGSNRTRDPCELAKYDVVLTTYSIVSMEVPKQPCVNEDDEEKGKSEDHGFSMGLSSSKKRKYPLSSNKKRSDKKGLDSALLDNARPLAKVGWFRVVLDEAQSIKNHRTQVARACWGLRAKRRWCLSGTPIQNAIDDLYSYFRFLKYDPFDAYKLFCTYIKTPISKNPSTGYRKLQTVLKTIMLRRTKGTLLDGEPIISLPPKFIELKRVDFSEQERDFYSQLEADSRAQFQEYAAAGTVKQNYVNILLMLLRLRQACDHPFLVKGIDSHSLLSSSVEMAKKLPQDEKEHLLKCLEGSLAICGICSDPPEDAVVAKCGHVFCNQCICEHLTGDDHQCPNTNCKARLNRYIVFSKATLSSPLHDQSSHDSSRDCTGLEVIQTGESCHEGHFKSSKIKAALDVLQSLCGPHDSSSGNSSTLNSSDENASSVENSLATCAVEPLKDVPDNRNLEAEEGTNSSIKVVGQKAIVFSQWTRMLDLLEGCLKHSCIKYRRLDGTMSVTARDKAVKDFNTLPEVSVMIMSLKAASLGLNMVAACHVLLLDLWWNPTTEDQAIDRAHRIGQTRPVTVLRLTVRDTVEDRILSLQQKKREMVASAFGEDEMGGRQTRLTVEDLKYLFMT
ncbi:SMARCA3-like protein 2 [Morus notabilis]|uniref:SMARCA3-like protein 2 n=1 Tax=Morus notabilis TaxID=981085 RepID=W9T2P6_9ROSA|nr:helicase-like transcription factor CHR28 isoform X2 [Morus notabilis]EXC53897.1 SMARCA3-like protein 2 [Morus notabilis]